MQFDLNSYSIATVFLLFIISIIIIAVGYLYTKRAKETGQNTLLFLTYGSIIVLFSNLVYFSYELSGHLLIITGFFYFYLAMYRSSVELPYEKLAIAEEKLRKGVENKYRTIFDNANDAIITTDLENLVTSWNRSATKLFGWEANEVMGKKLSGLIVPLNLQAHGEEIIRETIDGKSPLEIETKKIRKDGSMIFVSLTTSQLLDSNHNLAGLSFIIRDITERKRAEEIKTASAVKWQTTFDAINDGILIQDNELTILQCNSAMADILGKSTREITGRKCWEIVHHTLEPGEACPVLRTHKTHCREDEVVQLGDKWFKVTSDPLKDNSGNLTGTVHIFTDITGSKKAELEYKTILKTTMDGFYVTDSQGHILDVNDSYCSLIGYSREELLNMTLRDIDVIDTEEVIAQRIEQITKVGWARFETSHKCKDGRIVRIEASVNYMGIGSGKFYVFMRDITERKRVEDQIKASLREKEVLLREIHHRVKNNLQIVSSLLDHQTQYIKDKNVIDIFTESQNRIASMALVHEKLYQSKDLAKINVLDYINDLVANIFQSYVENSGKTRLNVNIENIQLDIDFAIPCGLIINELITNSLKHAFPAGRLGEIKIVFRKTEDNMHELVISDNGIGIPLDMDFRKTGSLGLHLVTILAENQLHGKITLNRDEGTEFIIEFKGINDPGTKIPDNI
jgi:PAS domain S-box-containing protein